MTNRAYVNERADKTINRLNTNIEGKMADIKEKVYRTSLFIDGTMVPTSSIHWNGHHISNLTDPIRQQDVATKIYVDQAIMCQTTTETLPPNTIRRGFSNIQFSKGKNIQNGKICIIGLWVERLLNELILYAIHSLMLCGNFLY